MTTVSIIVNAAPATVRDVPAGTTVRLLAQLLALVITSVKINGYDAGPDYVLAQGDEVKVTGHAAQPAAAPVAALDLATEMVPGTRTVLFINNDGTGFADRIPVAPGVTIEAFLAQRGYRTGGNEIRVNGQPVTRDYVLQNGDRVSVTPTKVQGAAEFISVLYLNNQGQGFADRINAIAGTTLGQFVGQRTGGGDVAGYEIRVNGQPADRGYVLQNGDRVSVTPSKVQGA